MGILCEFAMLPDMYILLSRQEEVALFFRGQMCIFDSTLIKKIEHFVYQYITTPGQYI